MRTTQQIFASCAMGNLFYRFLTSECRGGVMQSGIALHWVKNETGEMAAYTFSSHVSRFIVQFLNAVDDLRGAYPFVQAAMNGLTDADKQMIQRLKSTNDILTDEALDLGQGVIVRRLRENGREVDCVQRVAVALYNASVDAPPNTPMASSMDTFLRGYRNIAMSNASSGFDASQPQSCLA